MLFIFQFLFFVLGFQTRNLPKKTIVWTPEIHLFFIVIIICVHWFPFFLADWPVRRFTRHESFVIGTNCVWVSILEKERNTNRTWNRIKITPFLSLFFFLSGVVNEKLFSCCYCPECVCVRVDALPRVARTHKRRPIVKNDVKREKTGAKNRPSGVITPSPVNFEMNDETLREFDIGRRECDGGGGEKSRRCCSATIIELPARNRGPPLSCRLGLQHVETAQLSL